MTAKNERNFPYQGGDSTRMGEREGTKLVRGGSGRKVETKVVGHVLGQLGIYQSKVERRVCCTDAVQQKRWATFPEGYTGELIKRSGDSF